MHDGRTKEREIGRAIHVAYKTASNRPRCNASRFRFKGEMKDDRAGLGDGRSQVRRYPVYEKKRRASRRHYRIKSE